MQFLLTYNGFIWMFFINILNELFLYSDFILVFVFLAFLLVFLFFNAFILYTFLFLFWIYISYYYSI